MELVHSETKSPEVEKLETEGISQRRPARVVQPAVWGSLYL